VNKSDKQITEKDVMRIVEEYLTVHKIFHWRNNTGAYKDKTRFIRYGKQGSADFIGVCPDGRFLAIECKRPVGGRLTIDQIDFLHNVCMNGGIGLVVSSLESLETQLQQAGVI
jgi:hypothetical protein